MGTWTYLTPDGAVAFHVVRWENVDPNGRKVIRPATCESPDRPVVVAEGEKYADTAALVFPDCVSTTWAGGSGTWADTDWEPLAGREVLLVADADESGRAVMRNVAAHLSANGMHRTVCIYLPPGDDGFDIAAAVDCQDLEGMCKRIEAGALQWEIKAAVTPDTDERTDWMELLLERTKTDPGAPFEPDILEKMRNLKCNDMAAWERLRATLRTEARVRVGVLDKALTEQGKDNDRLLLQGRLLEWPASCPTMTFVAVKTASSRLGACCSARAISWCARGPRRSTRCAAIWRSSASLRPTVRFMSGVWRRRLTIRTWICRKQSAK